MDDLIRFERPEVSLTDKALVLDIDETMLHTFDHMKFYNKKIKDVCKLS